MKNTTSTLLAAAVLMTLAGTAHAQIINWTGDHAITGDADVYTQGTYVDGFQGAVAGVFGKDGVVETTSNGVAFNPNLGSYSDNTFSITGPGGAATGSDGFTSTGSAAYQATLSDCAYIAGTGTVTMSGLFAGSEYEIEVWNSTPYDPTVLTGSTVADSITAARNTFVLGTFYATGPTASFTFASTPDGSGVGVIDALELRNIPEPSTYALMIGGLAFLGFCVRRKGALVK